MAGRYLTDMADVLRAAGCDVEEVAGWQTRARSSGGYSGDRPYCIMWHHTASNPGTSAANNVSYIINGSSVAPVANLYLHNDGKFYVCAAGATNTNGKGDALAFSKGVVPADSMNTCAIGIEAGNSGVGEPWPQVMIDAYFKGSNALAAAYGMQPVDLSSHQHYAPGRKIDPATALAVMHRQQVEHHLHEVPSPDEGTQLYLQLGSEQPQRRFIEQGDVVLPGGIPSRVVGPHLRGVEVLLAHGSTKTITKVMIAIQQNIPSSKAKQNFAGVMPSSAGARRVSALLFGMPHTIALCVQKVGVKWGQ